jgi:hypothetical protein
VLLGSFWVQISYQQLIFLVRIYIICMRYKLCLGFKKKNDGRQHCFNISLTEEGMGGQVVKILTSDLKPNTGMCLLSDTHLKC